MAQMTVASVDTRLTLSDGFYAGLIGGGVLSAYFAACDALLRVPVDSLYRFMASAVLAKSALQGGWMPVALGIGILFLLAAVGGLVYAWLAHRIPALAKTPISSLTGLIYGFLVWLVFVDVIIPTTGMQETIDHPLWISAVGIGIFYGSALCEYLANVSRLRTHRAQQAAELAASQ
jgi:hypothetical protein